ncbi:MAG: carboxypeptidase-like regulatory domain-containing protein [Myxococcota bacterium]|nr:carboxypeptidase-like regulatory domain-containing protein [Myxococcota bacterium]
MSRSRACVALLLLVSTPVSAQSASAELGSLRTDLIYAPLAHRSGEILQQGYPIRYSGFAPSYFRASALWYPSGFFLGAAAELSVDTFVIRGDGLTPGVEERVWGTSAAVAGSARLRLNPSLELELQAGLGVWSVPFLLYDADVESNLATRQLQVFGPRLGAGGIWTTPSYGLEVRARLSPTAFTAGLGGLTSTSGHLSFNLQGTLGALHLGKFELVPLAGYELTAFGGQERTAADVEPTLKASQISHRLYLGLRAQFGEAMVKRVPTGPGSIRGQVLSETGEPMPGALVRVVGSATAQGISGPKGEFNLAQVPHGPVELEVDAAGYRVARLAMTLTPEAALSSSVRLEKKVGPGRITGRAFARNDDGAPGAPLAGVQVEGPDAQLVVSDAAGAFTLEKVGPGLVTVFIRSSGYQELEEVVEVPPETAAALEVSLARQKQKTLASLRGRVRSVAGKPIAAQLRIPEAKVAVRAGADGRFLLRLPGGRYSVVFSAPGFITQTKSLQVADGDQALFYVDLSPEER